MNAHESTSQGHRLGSVRHLDRHYLALQREYEDTLRSAAFRPGWHVLDAGSGNGLFLPLMSELLGPSGKISAVDLAPENIAAIETMIGRGDLACDAEAKVGDITELPYAQSRFDGLWCANVSQYLTDEQLSRALKEFCRVVKPGGTVAIKEVDISVWQFQPHSPLLMWRLLQAVQADAQLSGAMRGTRLPHWFREAGLLEITSKTTLAERRHPLRRVERDYIRGNLQFLSDLALKQKLPQSDLKEWAAVAEMPDTIMEHPDFCYRELYVLTSGRR